MKQRYLVAIIVGSLIGLLAMITIALQPDFPDEAEILGLTVIAPFTSDDHYEVKRHGETEIHDCNLRGQEIPGWDEFTTGYDAHTFRNTKPGQMLDLEHKALLLRMCGIMLKHGYLYLSIPSALACALTLLGELGQKNRLLGCLSKSLLFTSILTLAGCVLMGIAGALSYAFPRADSLEAALLESWINFLRWLITGITSGVAPVMWLVTFLTFLCTTSRQQKSRTGHQDAAK